MIEKQTIELWKMKGISGETIPKEEYEVLKEFILAILLKNDSIELRELLSDAHTTLSTIFKKDFSRLLLEVKQDLEAKGLIKVTRQANRMQFISIVRKNTLKEYVSYWGKH